MPATSIIGRGGAGRKTAAAGTAITQLIPPKRGAKSLLDKISVATGTTAHVLTALQALGRTVLTADVAAGANPLALAADPGPAGNALAAGDFVVVGKPDGTFLLTTVAGGTATAPTLTGNVPAGGLKAGAVLWHFGVPGDTVPYHGGTHPQYDLVASVTNVYDNASGNGVIASNYNYEPLVLHIDNAAVASTIRQVSWTYAQEYGSQIPPFAGPGGVPPEEQFASETEQGEQPAAAPTEEGEVIDERQPESEPAPQPAQPAGQPGQPGQQARPPRGGKAGGRR